MSLLGKKRTKRSEEDDKVINHLFNQIVQEYEKLAGIKEEEEENHEEEKEKEENNNKGKNEENPEIKIIENTINISSKERIKNTTVKKDSKNKKIEIKDKDEQKKDLFPKEKNKNEEKNIIKKEDKENVNNVSKNPFSILFNQANTSKESKDDKENKKEIKSLFGDIFKGNKQSLFDNKNKKEETKSLFNIPIKLDVKDNTDDNNKIKNNENDKNEKKEVSSGSIFGNLPLFSNNGGKSLFNNNDNNSKNPPQLLFSNMNNIKNPFSDIKGDAFAKSLFSNKEENNKNNAAEKEKDNTLFEGGDNDSDKSDENDKPKKNYVAEPLKAQSDYSKIFNLNLNNLFLYNKAEKKYISKGSGFFSIEKTKDEKQSVAVFRNHAGNKLVEGFLDPKFNKFDIFNKEFDYVVCFGIIMINEGKPEIGFIKIPFKNEDTAKELKEAFEKALDYTKKKD